MTKMKNIKVNLVDYICDETLESLIIAANERGIPYNEVFIGQRGYEDDITFAYYYREENDEEYNTRLAQEEKYNNLKIENDRKNYLKLKKQFEGK